MNRFELLAVKHNAHIYKRSEKANDVTLTRIEARPWRDAYNVISYSDRLTPEEAIAGVAIMFAALESRCEDKSLWFRFSMLSDDKQVWAAIRRQYRDFSPLVERASELLITDRMLHELKREGREPWVLCEEERLLPLIVGVRMGVVSPRNLYMVPKPHALFASQADAAMWCEM